MLLSNRRPGANRPALALLLVAGTLALTLLLALPLTSARADSPSQLTVVGTSDVQDSGLMAQLVTPLFEKAYPQFTLKYVSVGTGVAINDAESGVASALVVHAEALENQFVASGFSKERFGRAIFYGDYVLLGPTADPAGALTNTPHDIAGAFARIAAAGAAGKADFVSRGGTPGTTVQEHAIWALDAGTAGLNLCTVSSANGGGMAPSTASGGCPTTTANPSWYHTTGLTQGPNIEAANTCNFPNAAGGNDCYAFTDRGTFDCLMSSTCSGGSAAPGNLKIVASDNSSSAPGGATELINSFHAYAINPAKFANNPNVQINSTAATDFLNFITSPAFQAQLKTFLASTGQAPFSADASPSISVNKLPAKVTGGRRIAITGSVANLVPGTPPLDGVPVTVSEVLGLNTLLPVASGRTDISGNYSIAFSPPSTGNYQVSTGQILKVEKTQLSPIFGDILQPGASTPVKITVQGAIQGLTLTAQPGAVLATGSVLPGVDHVKGTVALLARSGNRGAFKQIANVSLGTIDHAFALSAARKPGKWAFEVRFQDPGQVLTTTTKSKQVTIPARSRASVSITSLTISNGRLTLQGKLSPAPGASAKVQLLGLDVGAIPSKTAKTSGSGRFGVVATGTVRAGATTFTLRGRLTRGQRWVVQLKYAADPAWGALRTVRVT